MKTLVPHGLRYLVIVGAVVAGVYALILARASYLFHQDTAVSVAAAVHLQPHNSEYLNRLASWQTDDRRALLQRAVAENPFDYNAWIRLGLMDEMQAGDNAAAEKCYLQAANVDHMFLPRWTLANFYFRQQRPDEFFNWSSQTLAVTPYASDPVFAQMWQMTHDENTIQAAIPDHPRILLQYAWYLANNKQYERIPRAVERLVHLVKPSDAGKWGRDDLLAASEDHMLAAGYLKPALDIWSSLKDAGWTQTPAPNEQNPLSNGDFRQPFFRHGFDWVIMDNPGSRVEQLEYVPEVRINLYGDQAEKITLMQQFVAMKPGAPYSMKWRPDSSGFSEPSGLAWHLHSIGGGAPEMISRDIAGPEAAWDFVAPAGAKTFLLTLEYTRALGTMRARGLLALKSVTMNRK